MLADATDTKDSKPPRVTNFISSPGDWKTAESLYLAGVPHADIVARTQVPLSALKQRIYRRKWRLKRLALADALEQHEKAKRVIKANPTNAPDRGVVDDGEWSERMRVKMRAKVESIVDALPDDAKTLTVLNTAADVVRKISAPQGGSDESTGPRIVDLGKLNESATVAPPAAVNGN